MLGAERHVTRPNERDEYHRHLHGREAMQVERLAGQVVQSRDRQSGFFTNLAHRGLFGTLTGIHPAMHDLPGSGASRSLGTTQDEHAQSLRDVPDDENVDNTNTQVGHDRNRRQVLRSSALSRALKARGRNGFVMKSLAPFSKTFTSLSSSPLAVSTSTGSSAVPCRARMWLNTW